MAQLKEKTEKVLLFFQMNCSSHLHLFVIPSGKNWLSKVILREEEPYSMDGPHIDSQPEC